MGDHYLYTRKETERRKELAQGVCDQFPASSDRQIARILWGAHSSFFTDYDDARNIVRLVRGHKHLRQGASRYKIPPFLDIDEQSQFKNWAPYVMDLPCTSLVLGDQHIPYHKRKVIEVSVQSGKKRGVNAVIVNGDVIDCYALSDWETDPTKHDFLAEVETTVAFLEYLRNSFPKARIVYKWGNHEQRYTRKMRKKCPEFLKIPAFDFREVFELERLGIELVRDAREVRVGDLSVIHGHEYKVGIAPPVSPARGLYLRTKDNALCNHFHRPSVHTGKTIKDKKICCWSVGCQCAINMEYAPFNEWVHGFAFVEAWNTGTFSVENMVVEDGKAVTT